MNYRQKFETRLPLSSEHKIWVGSTQIPVFAGMEDGDTRNALIALRKAIVRKINKTPQKGMFCSADLRITHAACQRDGSMLISGTVTWAVEVDSWIKISLCMYGDIEEVPTDEDL